MNDELNAMDVDLDDLEPTDEELDKIEAEMPSIMFEVRQMQLPKRAA
jgi:tetrahydromethanopterin S-methyltransferase subunit G